MRSLLLLWPKAPTIKPPAPLDRKRDSLGGKVSSLLFFRLKKREKTTLRWKEKVSQELMRDDDV